MADPASASNLQGPRAERMGPLLWEQIKLVLIITS
jgi:hypothetical protein